MEEGIKNKVRISVCGSEMTVVTDESEEYVAELASRLDKRVTELSITRGKCSKTEALILCAIEALDAAIKLKNKVSELKGSVGDE